MARNMMLSRWADTNGVSYADAERIKCIMGSRFQYGDLTRKQEERTMSADEKGYQGWKNYETWTVALWIDNEQGSHEYWREAAREIRDETPDVDQVQGGIWTAKEAHRFALAERLKEEHEDNKPETPGVWTDLINAALSEVNWDEIAQRILDSLD